MTDDEILLLADKHLYSGKNYDIINFARAVAAIEREACAKVCQEFLSMECADAIRARGE